MNEMPRTIRSAHALAAAGVLGGDAQTGIERVAAKYAVAVTPAVPS